MRFLRVNDVEFGLWSHTRDATSQEANNFACFTCLHWFGLNSLSSGRAGAERQLRPAINGRDALPRSHFTAPQWRELAL